MDSEHKNVVNLTLLYLNYSRELAKSLELRCTVQESLISIPPLVLERSCYSGCTSTASHTSPVAKSNYLGLGVVVAVRC